MGKLLIFNMGDDSFIVTDSYGNSLFSYTIKKEHKDETIGLHSGVVSNGLLYAIGSYNSRLYKIDYNTGNILSDTGCVGQYPVKVKICNDNIYVCCAESDSVHMFSKLTFSHIASVHTGVCITDMDMTEDKCIICTMSSRQLHILSLNGLYYITDFQLSFAPSAVLYDPSNSLIYLCGTETESYTGGVLTILNLDGEVLHQVQTGDVPVSMCLYKDSLVVSCSGNDCLAVHDKTNGKTLNWIKVQPLPGGLCCIEKEDMVFVCSQIENTINVVDMRLKRALFTFKTGREPTDIVQIS